MVPKQPVEALGINPGQWLLSLPQPYNCQRNSEGLVSSEAAAQIMSVVRMQGDELSVHMPSLFNSICDPNPWNDAVHKQEWSSYHEISIIVL